MIKEQNTRILTAGCYRLDDLRQGDVIETSAHLVSEDDITEFAKLSGDYFAIHMDKQAAIDAGFAGRVAHGLLVLSLIDGLKNRSQAQLDALASLGWNIEFSAPVIAGDTISARLTILDFRATSDNRRGVVSIEVKAINQHGTTVQHGINKLMIKK